MTTDQVGVSWLFADPVPAAPPEVDRVEGVPQLSKEQEIEQVALCDL